MAVMLQVQVFWVVTPYSVVGYHRFRRPSSLHPEDERCMDLWNVGNLSTTWCHNPQDLNLKCHFYLSLWSLLSRVEWKD